MDALLVLDAGAPGWPVVGSTPALAALTGFGPERLRARPWPALWDGDAHPAQVAALAAGVGARVAASAELPTLRRDAEPLATTVRVAPLDGSALVACTVLATVDAELARLAYTDPLTGLRNRHALDRDLAVALSRAARTEQGVAVLYVDLDGFKAVNDALGHRAGDAVLRETARRLAGSLRSHDIVARVGGDEFVIAICDLEPPARERALRVAGHVEEQLRGPIATPAGPASVGASVGIALHPADAADPELLLATADAAMYRHKRRGARSAADLAAVEASLLGRARDAQRVAASLHDTTTLLQDQVADARRRRATRDG